MRSSPAADAAAPRDRPASSGNYGLAVAYAGWAGGVPATIFLPRSVAADKILKLDEWGARVVMSGEVWHDSNREALHHAETEGLAYIHPFADPEVIAGQGRSPSRFSTRPPMSMRYSLPSAGLSPSRARGNKGSGLSL